jgi:thiol-disulfide isomerase/thioredoxin
MVVVGKSGKVEAVNVGNIGDLETRLKGQLDALIEGKPVPQVAATPPAPSQGQQPPAQPPQRPAMQLVGTQAPTFSISTLDGKKVSDAEFKNHPATVLNFVAPNCGFCKKQLPSVETVRAEYEAKGIRFVNVAQKMGAKEFTTEEMVDVFKGAGSRLELAKDTDNQVGQLFKAVSYPTMVVVNRGGKIEHVNIGAQQDLDKALKTQLDALITGKGSAPTGGR